MVSLASYSWLYPYVVCMQNNLKVEQSIVNIKVAILRVNDKKTVRRVGIEPIKRVFTSVLFLVIHFL